MLRIVDFTRVIRDDLGNKIGHFVRYHYKIPGDVEKFGNKPGKFTTLDTARIIKRIGWPPRGRKGATLSCLFGRSHGKIDERGESGTSDRYVVQCLCHNCTLHKYGYVRVRVCAYSRLREENK